MGRLRLLPGVMIAAAAAAAAQLPACGSPFEPTAATSTGTVTSSSTGEMTTTTTSSTGTGGAGGAGGATSTTGTASSSGTGGGGGAPCVVGDLSTCKAGEYCRVNGGGCAPCGDFSAFQFGDPKPVDVMIPQGAAASFPRRKGDKLYYMFKSLTSTDIAESDLMAMSMNKWTPGVAVAPPVSASDSDEAAPLVLSASEAQAIEGILLDKVAVKTGQPLLVFDSDRTSPGAPHVYAENPGQMGVSLLNLKGDAIVEHLTVAWDANPYRIWYITAKPGNLAPRLVTATPGSSPDDATMTISNGCPLLPGDVAPWVTHDGSHLIFSAIDPDLSAQCGAPMGTTHHVYIADLEPNGQQKAGTKAARVLPNDDKDDITPSLTQDACALYFSRTTGPGTGVLHAAVRQ
jgi:hypothetical protein